MLRFIGACFVLWIIWATGLLSLGLLLVGELFLGLGAFFG